MLAEIWALTGLVIAVGALRAYAKSGDALHPAVVMAGPFGYFYCVWPLLLNRDGGLDQFLPRDRLEYCALLFLIATAALYLGLNYRARLADSRAELRSLDGLAAHLPRPVIRKIFLAASVLGVAALAAYGSTFGYSYEAFLELYSQSKGGGRATSGYVGEAVNLSLPAILLVAVAVRGRGRLTVGDIALVVVFALPQLLHGTLGARRGPIFIILATLMFAWFIATRRSPRLLHIVGGIAAIGLVMLAIQENRRDVYLGSEESFSINRALDAVAPSEVDTGNEYLNAAAYVVTSDYQSDFSWGYRYLVILFVRPIPQQIWPTKYEDVGARWLEDFGSQGSNARIYEATGFTVPGGVSTGSIADGFAEFSWGVIFMFYLLGRLYAWIWRRHRTHGAYWTVLLFLMLGLSVYLPSQSFSAWLVRFLFCAAGSYFFLRIVGGGQILKRRPTPTQTLSPRHSSGRAL